MTVSQTNDPEDWREFAKKLRSIAKGMKDERSKMVMLKMAGAYEMLADRAVKRGNRSPEKTRKSRLRAIRLSKLTNSQ
jgi:hypothetical protein